MRTKTSGNGDGRGAPVGRLKNNMTFLTLLTQRDQAYSLRHQADLKHVGAFRNINNPSDLLKFQPAITAHKNHSRRPRREDGPQSLLQLLDLDRLLIQADRPVLVDA